MMDGSNDTRHQNLDYIPADLGEHFLVGLQLGGITASAGWTKSSCWVETTMVSMRTGVPVVIIFDGHLALGVGTEVGHHLALATDICQHLQDAVCKVQ